MTRSELTPSGDSTENPDDSGRAKLNSEEWFWNRTDFIRKVLWTSVIATLASATIAVAGDDIGNKLIATAGEDIAAISFSAAIAFGILEITEGRVRRQNGIIRPPKK